MCGTSGTSQCTSADVVIVSISRRRGSVSINFYVKTSSAAKATAGATTLNTFMNNAGAGGFLTTLKAKNTALNTKVTGMTVTSAAVGGTSQVPTPVVSATSTTAATVSLTSMALMLVALRQ